MSRKTWHLTQNGSATLCGASSLNKIQVGTEGDVWDAYPLSQTALRCQRCAVIARLPEWKAAK